MCGVDHIGRKRGKKVKLIVSKTKYFVLMCFCIGMIGMIAGCGQVEKNDKNTFTVGFDAEFPPYGYKDADGEYVGFDLSLAEEVCKRNGWKCVKQPIDWNSKDMELKTGTIDCIWNGFTMNGREKDYTARPPSPSPTPGVHSNSRPSSQ